MYGYLRDEALGRKPADLLSTRFSGASFDDVLSHLLDEGSWSGEATHTAKSGRLIAVQTRLELFAVNGTRLVFETAKDMTDRENWEKRLKLLLSELSHRVKNTLTVVQSIAHQTLRTSDCADEFVERFDGRLVALASAHRLLVASEWHGTELGDLAREQLEPYAPPDGSRLRIEGDTVVLPADFATPLGLLLHELATNAAKHGALSGPHGRVDLEWNVRPEGGQRILSLIWREQDGPAVVSSSRMGFGRRLIEQGLPDAKVSYELPPTGVVCSIELPIPGLRDDGISIEF